MPRRPAPQLGISISHEPLCTQNRFEPATDESIDRAIVIGSQHPLSCHADPARSMRKALATASTSRRVRRQAACFPERLVTFGFITPGRILFDVA